MKKLIRTLFVVPVLIITGYRFTKYHRHNNTLAYRLFSTTSANIQADDFILKRYNQIMNDI